MPLEEVARFTRATLIPAGGPLRRGAPYRVAPRWRVFAEHANEEEDRERRERRKDEGRPGRDTDRERAEIDVGADAHCPEKRDDAMIDRGRARHVRHVQDSNAASRCGPTRNNLRAAPSGLRGERASRATPRAVSTSCKVCCGNVDN